MEMSGSALECSEYPVMPGVLRGDPECTVLTLDYPSAPEISGVSWIMLSAPSSLLSNFLTAEFYTTLAVDNWFSASVTQQPWPWEPCWSFITISIMKLIIKNRTGNGHNSRLILRLDPGISFPVAGVMGNCVASQSPQALGT